MLGMEPAKVKPDYAKFELTDPPAIISLNVGVEPGTVSHLGIRYADPDTVVQELARTKAEGIAVHEQPGTTCCYAKADKFWVHDTDGLGWEMYTLLADAEVHSIVDTPEQVCCAPTTQESAEPAQATAESCCAPAGTVQISPQPAQTTKRSCC
jgi:hypothetical protein